MFKMSLVKGTMCSKTKENILLGFTADVIAGGGVRSGFAAEIVFKSTSSTVSPHNCGRLTCAR